MPFDIPSKRPALMGILNITPDSFSDGGVHLEASTAIDAGKRMADEGADLLDVGGESTRPGAEPVSVEDELKRVIPVVEGLVKAGLAVSIDTSKASVARVALQAGASVVNDVTAFRDPDMTGVCADAKCTICLMHMQGEPRTMQENPRYENVVTEVRDFLVQRAQSITGDGFPSEHIWLDPGIGFGKTVDHNLSLLKNLEALVATGYPVLVGVSRKSFIGRLLGGLPVEERLEGTLAAQVVAQLKGARIIRAHDVKEARRALDIAQAIADAN